jgi:hypothetical protein
MLIKQSPPEYETAEPEVKPCRRLFTEQPVAPAAVESPCHPLSLPW